ncbi:cytochrome c biogenesis protein CcmG, thiol-disulfide interchange protein DsbE [Legionella beliardensis]|uniref:Cytochrome c biogenesis protein CcmG, thiol-disulfide interchange protein DsbE n=1 Tax=Legionella beliardensis TaxID=91822 RepID=A0A378I7K9_9GAMM|nr:DsbE family thiol:disulfide interchange protein [Legionella beliardensis]STX28394.1 cytochrome c biogenesis protein CcmG, thiol-disulfide interchange protein DsbE [Legionella beliardensis]
MKKYILRVVPLILFATLAIFLGRGLFLEPQKLPSAQLGQALPAFKLPVLGAENKTFADSDLYGDVSILNVWASWCTACSEEQVFLLRLADVGVPIFGLNYKDNPENAKKWLAEWGNPYKKIGTDTGGKVAIDLGVYGAPETFLIDKQGKIRFRHVGVLDEKVWMDEFLPRIEQLKGQA